MNMAILGSLGSKPLAVTTTQWGQPTSAANVLNTFMRKHGDGVQYPAHNGSQGKDTLANLDKFRSSPAFNRLTPEQLTEFKQLVNAFAQASDGTFFARGAKGTNGGLKSAIDTANEAINQKMTSQRPGGARAPAPAPGARAPAPAPGAGAGRAPDPGVSARYTSLLNGSDQIPNGNAPINFAKTKGEIEGLPEVKGNPTLKTSASNLSTWSDILAFLQQVESNNAATDTLRRKAEYAKNIINTALIRAANLSTTPAGSASGGTSGTTAASTAGAQPSPAPADGDGDDYGEDLTYYGMPPGSGTQGADPSGSAQTP
jgi:hypothetical protein